MYIDDKYKKGAIGLSFLIFIFSIWYVVIQKSYFPRPPFWIPTNSEINSIIGLLCVLSLIPYTIVQYIGDKWLESVDQNVPRLLQDVTEDVKSGQSLIISLEENAHENYGSITKSLQRALIQFRFTSDLTNSMKWLGERLQRPSAKQMAAIFIEAYEAGGRVSEILQDSVYLFRSMDENRLNRNIKTRPYVLVVYISLVIFLLISWIIFNRFLIPMNNHTQIVTNNFGLNLRLLDMEYYRSILFWSALTESIIGGLIAGKISKGKTLSGLIHSVIMMSVSLSFFTFLM